MGMDEYGSCPFTKCACWKFGVDGCKYKTKLHCSGWLIKDYWRPNDLVLKLFCQ